MTFHLTDEQRMLREELGRYLEDRFDFAARTAVLETEAGWSPAAWKGLADELGLLGAAFPEAVGGLGGGAVENGLIMEALGESIALTPYLPSILCGARLIELTVGEQAGALLSRIFAAEAVLAFAHGEAAARNDRFCVATRADAVEGGYRLNGTKAIVLGAPWATQLLVSARTAGGVRDADGLSLFLVDPASAGVVMQAHRLVDGHAAADLVLNDVFVAADALVGEVGGAGRAIDRVLDEATAALCAEAVGCMRAMLRQTVQYVQDRKQFGMPLASFQVLQHRLVDMQLRVEHAASLASAAVAAREDDMRRAWIASAAKAFIAKAGDYVARNAVQLHGGVGMMEETPVAHYFKRMTVITGQLGSGAFHLGRFAATHAGVTVPADRILNDPQPPEVQPADPDDAFAADVRAFLDTHLTGDLALWAHRESSSFGHPVTTERWQPLLAERGWGAPAWPAEHGGPGWTPAQRQLFEREMALAGAPRLPAMGISMCAPVIMRFGTPEQKAHFLPRILSGEHYWCQGYSEPGAGSDLAGLQLDARRDGDDYVLNGTKMWTTFAHYANWVFVLARTARGDKPQAGISFLLMPIDTPGITIRPLISLSGEHEVNQLFFDDVRVPVSNRIGEENQGWTVAKYLLEFERGVGHQVPALTAELAKLRTIAWREPGEDGAPLWTDPAFRRRYAELEIAVLALALTEERMVYSLPTGASVGDATASIMKLGWSKLAQRVDTLMVEALGAKGAIDNRAVLDGSAERPESVPEYALTPMARYFNDRAMTIAGGSSEVQYNILARLLLR